MKSLYIKTYGCQMNVYDSVKMADLLKPYGFGIVDSPEHADMVILNTCHIREKAAEKVYSELGRMAKIKRAREKNGDSMVIAVAGCVAQAEGEEVIRRAPFVDIVVGPQSYQDLPVLLEETRRKKSWVLNLELKENSKFDQLAPDSGSQGYSAFLSVQEGCNKFCRYCVVPYTRGAEYSRPVADIYNEALRIIDGGSVEITLLGQNINAYHGNGPNGNVWSLGRLIKYLASIEGLQRIRYTTSHPKDMTDEELFYAHATESKLMPFIHLPIQSGSDVILKAMNRRYNVGFYISIIEKFRKIKPDIAFSSDFIVGYPGETEEDFIATMQLVEHVNYAHAYSFKYSPRPGTPASVLPSQIPEDIKSERLARLQSLLCKQQLNFNQAKVGQVLRILVENQGRSGSQMMGKSPYMQSIIIDDGSKLFGKFVDVKITSAAQNSLKGHKF
ncbi:tRNA-2-methylthio-N(6)-dimethylallyladenosine synthase [Alphaproteobacteria bacterium]